MRRFIPIVILVLAVGALAACGDDAAPTTAAPTTTGGASTTGGECAQIDTLKLGYPGLPPDFIQMVAPLADDLGYFAEQCLEVEFTEFESGIAAFRAMVAGEMDMGFSGSISPILAFAEGADDVVFGSHGALLDFVVIGIGELQSCEDLEGRIVATEGPGGLQHAVMEAFLASCGLDIDTDVQLVIADPETYAAQFAQEAIEATDLHIDEALFLAQELGIEFNILGRAWEFAPDFHYASYATARPVLEQKRDQFVRFQAALLESGAWMQDPANRDDAIARIARISENPEDIVIQAYEEFGAKFPSTCAEALPMSSFEFLINLQVQLGNLDAVFPAADLVDLSVCADAERLLGREVTNPPTG